MPVHQKIICRCDKCNTDIDENDTDMEIISFFKIGMNQPKHIVLCHVCSREFEVVIKKWWKESTSVLYSEYID